MKILFSAHDPGGCNMLIPIIETLTKNDAFSISIVFIGPAVGKLLQIDTSRANVIKLPTKAIENFPNECDVNPQEVKAILENVKPDIVLTSTSINSNIERYFIRSTQDLKVKNYVFIDSWAGEDVRFNSPNVSVVPDNIFVCDTPMAESYTKYKELGANVINVGNPHLEVLSKRKFPARTQHSDIPVILFCCENIRHYFPNKKVNEFTIIEDIIEEVHNTGIKIIIRPHPMESKEPWQNFFEHNKSLTGKLVLELDCRLSIYDSFLNSDIVVGISSMALIESAILGVPTFSYQFGIEVDSDMLYIPFHEYGIKVLAFPMNLKEALATILTSSQPDVRSNSRHINAISNTISELIGNV